MISTTAYSRGKALNGWGSNLNRPGIIPLDQKEPTQGKDAIFQKVSCFLATNLYPGPSIDVCMAHIHDFSRAEFLYHELLHVYSSYYTRTQTALNSQ
jgi:hypothetical protein